MYAEDTIAAISTPVGEGGIGIVRISGPGAAGIANRIVRNGKGGGFESHRFYYGSLLDPDSGETIDEVMSVLMRGPRSYTREDVLEIHCHGGSLVVRRVLDAAIRCRARVAEPGEFTRRAFLNGRIDLLQAESVIDIIRSRTEKALALAESRREGHLSGKLFAIRDELIEALSLLEAYIDFPEEEIDGLSEDRITSAAVHAGDELAALLSTFDSGRAFRDGVSVVIAGKPNVGKSSLLNALLREKRSIVTSIPGTTRDVIEEVAAIEGLPVRFSDTAGLRETEDEVEKIGVEMTRERLRDADLILFLIDGSRPFDGEDADVLSSVAGKLWYPVVNKSDLPRVALLPPDVEADALPISTRSGEGLESLRRRIYGAFVSGEAIDSRELCAISDVRHRDAIRDAVAAIDRFTAGFAGGSPAEIAAADLREALHRVGDVTGETTPDEILDNIFGKFCIGK
jgi:tRNA modification GTPase